MAPNRRAGAVVALYAACMVYLVPVFPHYPSANELSRWAAVAGLVEHGTLETSWSQPLIGPLVDASRVGDRVYSNKAPGLALLALPGYLAARPLLGPPDAADLRWSLFAMRVGAVTVPAVLMGLLVLRRTRGDPFAAATLLFATPVFVYGALLFSHVTVAALLVAAFELLFPRAPGSGRRAALAAGALCGLATLTEYPAALATAILAAGILAGNDRWRRLAAFVAGGAPFAVLLGLYNRALFGSALSLSSANEAYANTAALASRGVFGISGPTPDSVFTLLASPSRGLLFFSPVLVFGLVALWPRGERDERTRAWVRLAVVAVLGLAMLSYPANAGGWCVGARYLVAVVPFLVLAAAERGVRPGVTTAACLAFSAALCVTPLLTFPFAPMEFTFVHATMIRPFLATGFATPNLASGITPGIVSLLPVAAAAVAAVALAVAGGGRRALAGAAGGALLAAGVVFAPVQDTVAEKAFRALLLDTHFVPAGRLERLAAETDDPQLRAQLEELAALSDGTRQLAPDGWPYR